MFTRESYAYIKFEEILEGLNENRHFLNNQFKKYGESCGEFLLTLIHNQFNNYFARIKRNRNFKPSGIDLSNLIRQLNGSQDLNFLLQQRKHTGDNDSGKSNKKRKQGKFGRGNNNNNNNTQPVNGTTNWKLDGNYRDSFNLDKMRTPMDPKIPKYHGKALSDNMTFSATWRTDVGSIMEM